MRGDQDRSIIAIIVFINVDVSDVHFELICDMKMYLGKTVAR